jgi:uncharacterized RDD family membrane protein YckC
MNNPPLRPVNIPGRAHEEGTVLGDPVVTEQSSRPRTQESLVSTTYLEHLPASSSIPAEDLSYAGFWRRLVASLLDFIIIGILMFICRFGLNAIGLDLLTGPLIGGDRTGSSWWTAFMFNESVLSLALGTLYFGFFESSIWQASLGKRALGIIVTDLDHQRISPARAIGRHLATLLSSAIFFIGYLIQPFTNKRQALHDIIAGTLVLKK